MEGDYRLNSTDFSLAVISAVAVVHHVLKASGKEAQSGTSSKAVEEEAAERIAKSDWPHRVKTQVGNLIKPINEEIDSIPLGVEPIFTVQGTVDAMESLKAAVPCEMVSFRKRHTAACTLISCNYMYEFVREEIEDKLGRNDVQWSGPCAAFFKRMQAFKRPIRSRWLQVMRLCVHSILALHDFLQSGPTEFLDDLDSLATNLLNGVHPEQLVKFYESETRRFHICGSHRGLTPALHVSLFSKLNEFQQQKLPWVYYAHLLEAMLQWPYQRFFPSAAHALVCHLNAFSFWWIALGIAYKLAHDYKDYDYRGLFNAFWDMGACCRGGDVMGYSFGFHEVFNVPAAEETDFRRFLLEALDTDKEGLRRNIPLANELLRESIFTKFPYLTT